MDIERVEKGFGSWGPAANFMDPQERMALQEKAKAWADHQRKLLGMPGRESPREFMGRNRAVRGLGNRDRMRYLSGR